MLAFISVLIMIVLDQIVKYWTVSALKPVGSIPIWENVFHLTYVENRGAAFSILQGQKLFFVAVTIFVLILIFIAFRKNWIGHFTGKWALLMVAGGAIGNVIDRIFRGFVVDMFDFCLINYPVFNVADIFVVCGGILLIYYVMFKHPDPEKKDEH